MTFFAFGVNHQTAPVRVREHVSMPEARLREVYRRLDAANCEFVIISTCNRTEAYIYGTEDDVDLVRRTIEAVTQSRWPAGDDFTLRDEEAVRHLFGVVTGLRSLVLGDGQIFSQMKDAYRLAVDEDAVGTAMHRLMHTAFRAAKRVIAETLLTSGNASVAGAAVAVARDFFLRQDGRGLEHRHALILGAGQMGALALEALASSDVASVSIANRTRSRAERIAEPASATVVDWSDRFAAAADADLIFVTTGASDFVLAAGDLAVRDRPALLVDISVPRNVDPALAAVPTYEVIDLDDLNRMLVDAERMRRDAIPAAEGICEEHLEEFVSWVLHHQSMQPAIQAIAGTFDQIRRQEIDRHAHRFADLDRRQLDRLTRSIMQKLLAVPIVRLKSTDPDSVDFVRGVEMLRALFARPGCEDGVPGDDARLEGDEILGRLLALDFPLEDESRRHSP